MIRNIALLFLVGLAIAISSCRKDFDSQPSQGNLEFSKDTVYLDTVFSQIGSSTYQLKVYNRENHTVSIPKIKLGKGNASGYRLNVDGVSGKSFENVELLANDSLFVFIETTIDYQSVINPLYVDELLFDEGVNQQKVQLVTLVQDAVFLFPDKVNNVIETLVLDGEPTELQGRYLSNDELTFTNQKPYVIYGYMAVGSSTNQAKTLTIQAGAKVHFHANSGIIVNPNSSLHINGSLNVEGQPETEVVLQGDRLEPAFEHVPGQWGFIYLRNGSGNHSIQYATIKNGTIGVLVEGVTASNPTLTIENTTIINHSLAGILARLSRINGKNVVTQNCGLSGFIGMLGGVYDFTHCTFANYWSGTRSTPSVWLGNTNFIKFSEEETNFSADFYATFTNCIIYGNKNIELLFEKVEGTVFEYQFQNNLIRFKDDTNTYTGNSLYHFNDTTHYTANIINQDPHFKPEWITVNRMQIGQNSAGIGKALYSGGTSSIPQDIVGVIRANPADIGAYEHIEF